MTAVLSNNATSQHEWLDQLTALMTEITGWCNTRGWAVHGAAKPISEASFGTYSAPTLQIRTSNGGIVYVEPVARYVTAADGLVDMYAWPSLRRLLLIRKEGSWHIRTDSGVPLPWKWSEESFTQAVEALTSTE